MKRPGDPVTMACYGEGSGSQARVCIQHISEESHYLFRYTK